MDLTKKWKIVAAICFILSLALFASIIPFENTHLSMVGFESLSEKEINDEQDFQKQTAKYNKNYKDTKEYAKRKDIFVQNKDYIERINAEILKNYTQTNSSKYYASQPVLALNQFADWTPEEY